MDSMDRSAIVYASARAEASESLGQIQALSREMAEFKEIHASTIDSLQFESKQIQSKLAEHRRAAETRQGSLGGSANLQEFWGREGVTFLQSREFKKILGPKAFKFLKICFQSC